MIGLLAGDIGGTKTILRLVKTEDAPDSALETLYESRYISAEYPDLTPIVQQFLEEAIAQVGQLPLIEKACFAIAGPVVQNTSKLTNLSWILDAKRLSRDLQIAQVVLINDFVAVGYGVLGLKAEDLYTLQAGKPDSTAPIAVIGAGTGLGQGFLMRQGDRYQVYSSEGGHADFAPRSDLEFRLMHYLLEKHGISRVSAERVVSGMGILSIYQFLRDCQKLPESPDIAAVVRSWEQQLGRSEKSVDPGAVIGAAAVERRDRLAEYTIQLFVEAYGAEAGNLALKILPHGGLYIAGGIAAKILPLMTDGNFLKAFLSKGRMTSLLERVPVYIVLNSQVGLIGAAVCASQL
jgi:glucokinase